MGKREHLSLRKDIPAWLAGLSTQDANGHWEHLLAIALDLEVDGHGASAGLELSAFALGLHGKALRSQELGDAALVAATMAATARASVTHKLLADQSGLPPDATSLILERLNTRLRRGGPGSQGTAIAFSILLRDAMRNKHRIGHATVQRMSSMAGACLAGSRHPDRERWLALEKLQPFAVTALDEFRQQYGEGEPVTLAIALRKARANTADIPLPLAVLSRPDTDDTVLPPLPLAPTRRVHEEAQKEAPVTTGPNWAALHAAASHAGMAETFSLELAHDRIDVSQLRLVGMACRKVLRDPTDNTLMDEALLQSMAEVLDHDHDNSLDLALSPEIGDDSWYCAQLRCVVQDRRARRGLSTDGSRREWEGVYVYPEACDRIQHLLQLTPDAQRLRQLMPLRGRAELVLSTAAWVKSLTDQAHPATPGRAVHSTCLAYMKAGATDIEASMMARAPAAASSSAGNYYAPKPHRHHQLACAAFELLGREQPPPIAQSPLLSPPDVPDDDDVRTEWLMLRERVRNTFEDIDAAGIAKVADLLTSGMAACRKAYELLSAARDQVRQHPRIVDVSSSDEWHFDADKDTLINSDRLLPFTAELDEVIRVALLLRQKARDRLVDLGVSVDAMPKALAKVAPETSLFCQLRALPSASGLRLVIGVLNDKLMAHQRWKGPLNMGRRYWVGQASEHGAWLDEQALTGHGRGLRHMGSHCLSVSPRRLLASAKHLVKATLGRLALPAFGEGIAGTPEPIVVPVDLRSVDRRRDCKTRPTDMPFHYAEWRTPGFLAVVDRLRPSVGKECGLSSAARALLSLIVAQGLCHSADVRDAWPSLKEQRRKSGSVWIDWVRESGQPIEMPLLAPVRLAADEVTEWPSLIEVESELRHWLEDLNAEHPLRPVLWPRKPGATVAALCWVMAHWVRVHMAAFLALAYSPDLIAATLDRRSLDLLQHREAPGRTLKFSGFRSRLSKVRPEATSKDSLLWIQAQVGNIAKSKRRLGERQKRAGKVQRALASSIAVNAENQDIDRADDTSEQRRDRWAREAAEVDAKLLKTAPRTLMSPKARMLLVYLDAEATLTRARDPDANAPGTWYDYLSAVRLLLEDCWPGSADPTQILGRRWRKITGKILARQPGDTDITHGTRRKAWRRMLTVLSAQPGYGEAAAALAEPGAQSRPAKYIPSAASSLWPRRRLPAIQKGIDELLAGEPLALPQAQALLSLLLDAGPRRSEACAVRLQDFAEDGTWLQRFPSGRDKKKTSLAVGRSLLKPSTAAVLRDLRGLLKSLRAPPAYFFGESATDDSSTYAQTLIDVIVDIARDKIGSDLVVAHGARGSAAMELLVPGWESRIEAFAQSAFRLSDALAIVTALEGDGPDHMAHMLCAIGQASHKTFTRRYSASWPLLYAASMRALLAEVELDPALIRKMPHLKTEEEQEKAIARRRRARCDDEKKGPTDDWDWPLSHHYPKQKPGPKPKPAKAVPVPGRAALVVDGTPRAPRPMKLPAFLSLLNYLVCRHIGLKTVPAAKAAKVDMPVAAWLDQSDCAPREAAPDAEAEPKEPDAGVADQPKSPTNAVTSALNLLTGSDGQGLVAAIAIASPLWLPLAGLLRDSYLAPPVTTALVASLRDLLPETLEVYVAPSSTYYPEALAEELDKLDRVYVDSSSNVERWRPRLQVMPAKLAKDGNPNYSRTFTLTRLATLALSICPVLAEIVQ